MNQFVMGGFQVGAKIDAMTAYERFPEQRLHRLEDGQVSGNVILDENGAQHPLDKHTSFERRIKNYIIGTNEICMETPEEIALAREQTLEMLRELKPAEHFIEWAWHPDDVPPCSCTRVSSRHSSASWMIPTDCDRTA